MKPELVLLYICDGATLDFIKSYHSEVYFSVRAMHFEFLVEHAKEVHLIYAVYNQLHLQEYYHEVLVVKDQIPKYVDMNFQGCRVTFESDEQKMLFILKYL